MMFPGTVVKITKGGYRNNNQTAYARRFAEVIEEDDLIYVCWRNQMQEALSLHIGYSNQLAKVSKKHKPLAVCIKAGRNPLI